MCKHVRSLVLKDQDSLLIDDKLDVWPRAAGCGLSNTEEVGDGDMDLSQEALLDDEVDIMDKVKRSSTLDVPLSEEVVAGFCLYSVELDLQRVHESRGLQAVLKCVRLEGDDGLWGFGDAGGMPAGADSLVGTRS